MSIALFDKIATNYHLLLSLPFREGSGVITRDVAKPQHQDVDLVGFPDWVSLASGLGVLDFNGTTDYLECPAAATADLDFTSEDYSILAWSNHQFSAQSQMIVGRYGVDLDGWELYLYDTPPHNYLTLRHHHNSLAPDTRDGCYSDGWDNDTWYLLGISKSGNYPVHYRNGEEVEVTYETGGLKDPDTCNRDMVIGSRYTKNADWYNGCLWGIRVLGSICLSAIQHRFIFNRESHWFGVN